MQKMTNYLQTCEQWLVLKNYSTATQQIYLNAVRYCWRWCEAQQRDNPQFRKDLAVLLWRS